MKIREILHGKGSEVYSIAPEHTVLDAVAQLNAHRIGALIVRDAAGAVVGIITERDVLRECLHHSAELGRRRVRDVMTTNLIVCVADDDVDYAMAIVTQNRVRHLPVLDGDGLAGLVSIGDLVKATLDETQHENRDLKDYIAAR
jgi:CBS domain-containing protein